MKSSAKCASTFFAILFGSALLIAQDRNSLLEKINATKGFLLKARMTSNYRDSIRSSTLAYERNLRQHCENVELDFDSVDVRDRILAVVELDEKGMAVAGVWRESIPGMACNEKRRFNVQIDVTRGGLRFTPTFPGDAAGNPELQNDTLRNIEINFQMLRIPVKKSCDVEVVDTHLVGPPSTLLDSGILSPWKESWMVRSCGKVYEVPISYTPDARGTRISVATTEIHASSTD